MADGQNEWSGCGTMHAWAKLKGDALESYRITSGSLGVTLRAQPGDAAVAVHPVIDIGFAFQAGDFTGVGARVFSHDIPVVVCVPDGFEGYFCFCHALLCRLSGKK
jgi:hypothetical protein